MAVNKKRGRSTKGRVLPADPPLQHLWHVHTTWGELGVRNRLLFRVVTTASQLRSAGDVLRKAEQLVKSNAYIYPGLAISGIDYQGAIDA